jgi:hypothetical protein
MLQPAMRIRSGIVGLLASVLVCAALVPTSANAVGIGISDQNASMFANPLFGALDIKYARYVTPWDVALNPDSPAAKNLDAWLAGAQAAGVSPMIAFERRAGDQCPNQPCYLPDPSEYLQAFLAFRAKYPQIKTVSVWNEANHSTQPTFRSSVDAAQLYLVVARHCSGCTIVAADVLDNFSDFSQKMSKWLRTFSSVAPRARLWGLHNWSDVNRFEEVGLKAMLKSVKGDVWLTETGGINSFITQAGTKSFKPSESRAVKAMNWLFDDVVDYSRRVKRVYVYNWLSEPTNRWDSGLLDHNGHPRRTYDVLKKHSTR